ncbi:uncharacterized protein GGS22DRAFT_192185 [Annulohypoxylon maeteangense]|uniref:uncharacterized protein n=1 Tax=Annulohypoxylon maeteangense TaxID=1927788 RepID=UPI0020071EE9|nr:uncharacterized protein GGS22DRAFT_192185 [Annulohypoxylon maeteangense]KAI0881551.1 hypothetical protein GGS22DRAFT_192185 [Annulohypoxylon maeteangense]
MKTGIFLLSSIIAGVAAMVTFSRSSALQTRLICCIKDIANTSTTSFILPDGYTAVPFSIQGSIERGGEVMAFNGTLNSHTVCKIPDYPSGGRAKLLSGYDFLKKIHQPCEVAGGPRKCAMLWCSLGTSIWMCNDNTDKITRDCGDMASYVLDIIGNLDCITMWGGSEALILGQEFDTDGFNIIAGGGGCPV